jgi:hypothetical protein
MERRKLKYAILVFVIGTAAACSTNNVPREGRLHLYSNDIAVLLGDSLTAEFHWWTLFVATVNAYYAQKNRPPPTFINSGVNGDATNDIDVQARVIAHNPTVLIYGPMGINDAGNIDPALSAQQYALTWDTSLAALPRLRGMGMSPWVRLMPGQGVDAGYSAEMQNLRTIFANICRARGIPFVDHRAHWDTAHYSQLEALALNADGFHPTDPAGRALLSNQVLHQVELHAENRP